MARFCENCGSPIQEGYSFCENCGAPVEGAAVEVASASADQAEEACADQAADSLSGDAFAPAEKENVQAGEAFGNQADAGRVPFGQPNPMGSDDGFRPAPTGPIFNAGMPKKASGLAIASLVLGIISIVTGFFIVGIVFGIVAIVLYAVARKTKGKSGIGLAGLITGIIGSAMSLLTIAIVVISLFVLSAAGLDLDDLEDLEDFDDVAIGDVSGTYTEDANLMRVWHFDDAYISDSSETTEYSVLDAQEAHALAASKDSATLTIGPDGTFVMSFASYSKTGTWFVEDGLLVFQCDENGNTMWGFCYNDDTDVDYTPGVTFDEISVFDGGNVYVFE